MIFCSMECFTCAERTLECKQVFCETLHLLSEEYLNRTEKTKMNLSICDALLVPR